MIRVIATPSAYEVVHGINKYMRLQTPVLDWLKVNAGANRGFTHAREDLAGDWCWDYLGTYPNFEVRVYFRDPAPAMLFKLMWGGNV